MGIVSHIFSKIVKTGSLYGVAFATENLVKGIKSNSKKKTKKFLEGKEEHIKLVLSQDKRKINETFKVLDQNNNIKYTVKGKFLSLKHNLSVYDSSSKKIAEVIENLLAIRLPITFENHPKDFSLYVEGKKVGKIKSRFAFINNKYICKFNGWKIVGDPLGINYKIYSQDGTLIMNMQYKISVREDLYFIDIYREKDELLCLLIALMIDSASCSKSNDNNRGFKRITKKIIWGESCYEKE